MTRADNVRAWLRERGAEQIPHAGGSLYEHLNRVRDRLAAHGLSEDEQLAGLTHAAYGTDGFPVVLLDVTERQRLREVIGPARPHHRLARRSRQRRPSGSYASR